MNPRQKQLLWILVWLALVVFGLLQRGRISSMQQQVYDDLSVMERRRSVMHAKGEALVARERALVEREMKLKGLGSEPVAGGAGEGGTECCKAKMLLEQQLREAQQKIQDQARTIDLLKKGEKVEEKQATTVPATASPGISPGAAHIPSGEHQHGAHNAVKHFDKFMAKSIKAPEFLEPSAKTWEFVREERNDIGYLNLMPWPKKVQFGKQFVAAGNPNHGELKVTWEKESSGKFKDQAVSRLNKRIASLWSGAGGSVCPLKEKCKWVTDAVVFTVHVVCKKEYTPILSVGVSEKYTLRILESGRIEIEAEEAVGVLRAFASLVQLLTFEHERPFFPIVEISDEPTYAWRGVMLDVARNFHPVEQIMALLDGMEVVKLNVFHWHLSDDQGFRMESKTFPKLHELGSGGGSEFFTQEQIKEVVEQANLRGIRVVPEVDMPAHVGAILLGYPELAASAVTVPTKLVGKWGVLKYVLDPTKDAVYEWIEKFIEEMVTLFPDEYYHIGGDEVPPGSWGGGELSKLKDAGVRDQHGIQLHFNKKLNQILAKNQRKMIGWDEITVAWLPKNVTVQIWRGWMPQVIRQVADLGLKSISSAELYLDWVRPIKHYYKHDVRMSRGRVGGEACMWSEWASHNVDNRLWPTLAAIAEKLWLSEEAHGGVQQMYGRMFGISETLHALGVPHQNVYEVAIDSLISGKVYGYQDVLDFKSAASAASHNILKRFLNCFQPLNRVGSGDGGHKHDLVDLVDALRPDSLEMRALAALTDHVVAAKFNDADKVAMLRASLLLYKKLEQEMSDAKVFDVPAISVGKTLAATVSSIASDAIDLLDAIGQDSSKVQSLKTNLLQRIAREENAMMGDAKIIIEFAHVVETSLCKRI